MAGVMKPQATRGSVHFTSLFGQPQPLASAEGSPPGSLLSSHAGSQSMWDPSSASQGTASDIQPMHMSMIPEQQQQ